jgi:hypothetical protein
MRFKIQVRSLFAEILTADVVMKMIILRVLMIYALEM